MLADDTKIWSLIRTITLQVGLQVHVQVSICYFSYRVDCLSCDQLVGIYSLSSSHTSSVH